MKVSDLQSDIAFRGDQITGKLKYVEDFSVAFPDEGEKSGNFLSLTFDGMNADKIEMELEGGDHPGPVDVTSDKFCVFRIKDKTKQKIKVTATKNDDESTDTRTFDLSLLELESKKD